MTFIFTFNKGRDLRVTRKRIWRLGALALALGMLVACGDDAPGANRGKQAGSGGSAQDGSDRGGAGAGSSTTGTQANGYSFESRFAPGESSVKVSGQVFRQLLIGRLKSYVGGMSEEIDSGRFAPTDAATVLQALNYYYAFDSQTSGTDGHGMKIDGAFLQQTFDEISSGKNLAAKMAGNDSATDHRDWSSAFVGWRDQAIASSGGSITSPEGLLFAFFNRLAKQATDRTNGVVPLEPATSTPIREVYLTPEGHDLRQLMQKLLLVGVTYAQASDDYLDGDIDGKGLMATNAQDGDKPYSVLEHHWDEAFGYFGASRDYDGYRDAEIASKEEGSRDGWRGMHDSNGDDKIDLTRELPWGISINAAKRDLGASTARDFSGDAFSAFLEGRRLISQAGTSLTEEEQKALRQHADQVIATWELTLVATIVHYLNETTNDTLAVDGDTYEFATHAKHWSELKGFALGLQFNPRKKISDQDFATLHELIADAPALANRSKEERQRYADDLHAARGLLQKTYGLAAENVQSW